MAEQNASVFAIMIPNSSEQLAHQYCNIPSQYCNFPSQYCNFPRKRTTGLALIEIRAVLIVQEAKYKLVYLPQLFIASLTLRLHSTEQYIQKHDTNHATEKHTNRKITQCILHAGMRPYVHNKYFNWLALNMVQHFNTRARVLKRTRDVILSGNIIFYSLQGLHR